MTLSPKTLSGLALLLTLSTAGCDSPEQKEARFLKHGTAYMVRGDYDKARLEFRNAARLAPTDAEPAYRLGLLDETQGDLRSAFAAYTVAEQQNSHFAPAALKVAQFYMGAEYYDQAHKRVDLVLTDDPDNTEAHAVLAALLLREKNFEGAEKEARQALLKDPANLTATAALTGLYAAQGDAEKADKVLEDGIARNPIELSLLILRAELAQKSGDFIKIAHAYQAIFRLKPSADTYRIDLALLYAKAGRFDDAEMTLRDAVAALPNDWELKHQLVLFLTQYRSPAKAEQELKNLVQAYPENDTPSFWLADAYEAKKDTSRAEDVLQKIVAHPAATPSMLNARTALARLNIAHGNLPLAENLIHDVLAGSPDNIPALLIRSSMELDKGEYQNAVSDLRNVLHTNPNQPEALRLLAETMVLQNRFDLAIDTIKKLVDLQPDAILVRVRLAQMLLMNGSQKEALDVIGGVTKASPTLAVGWETAARIAIAAAEWLPAEQAISTLNKIEGQHATATYLEGQVYQRNGRDDEALAKFSEVVNLDPTTPIAEHALTDMMSSYQKKGRMADALTYLQSLRPDSALIETLIGACFVAMSEKAQAADAFDKAISLNPQFQQPYLDRAALYQEAGNSQAAIDILKTGANAIPGDFRAIMNAATLLALTGKSQDAITLYDDILTLNPDLDVAANNEAELIADTEGNDQTELEKGRKLAERFTASHNPLYLDTLAWIYYRQGKVDQAQTIMERAINTSGSAELPAQLHYHYASILTKSGKLDPAKGELDLALHDDSNYPGKDEARHLRASYP